MLTSTKLKAGEGELKPFNPKIGHVTRRKEIDEENYGAKTEKAFRKSFYQMTDKVQKLFVDYQMILENKIRKHVSAVGGTSEKKGNGGEHPKTLPSPSSSSSRVSSSSTSYDAHEKHFDKSDMYM